VGDAGGGLVKDVAIAAIPFRFDARFGFLIRAENLVPIEGHAV
jgi:hypothetical protein